jgi:uncharacterized SAM-binding protein YcdF (DUF218 family)
MTLPRLFKRRSVWCPTIIGWLIFAAAFGGVASWWWFEGESFLSLTERQPADILVVEGWIGIDGVGAAGAEFRQGGYSRIVTTSGLTDNRWDPQRYSYAEMAAERLELSGIPRDRIIVARPRDSGAQRTYESAVAALQAVQTSGFHPKAINVFTVGPHARRSRLIFSKVFGPETQVGVISWVPEGSLQTPWWKSTDRAVEMMRETIGYAYESMLNSGRGFSSKPAAVPSQ